jgi:alpha-N-arabinofuranosidase
MDSGNGQRFSNPILPGFYPDPSICRAGDSFYLVNSSFAYFPGIPVHRSSDLVHWELIGHALDRISQLDLDGAGISRGLFAPTIRFHAGIFYILCTNVDKGGTFMITATNPSGPWSEPFWLPDAPGIDPSLFFDEDGKAWICGSRPAPEGERYPGNWEIWISGFDPASFRLTGEIREIWRGSLADCVWPEGPHIYKKDEWYYLLIAEGGTERNHAVSVARSRFLSGPWEGCPANPILTHRHLGISSPIVNTGHGDLVEDGTGSWWMVLLASRSVEGHVLLGRETFLIPVSWENFWPVASPGAGRLEPAYPSPRLSSPLSGHTFTEQELDNFEGKRLDPSWVSLRTPRREFCSLTERPGFLRLFMLPACLRDRAQVSFAGKRLRHLDWHAETTLEFASILPNECAGLVLLQSEDYQYRLEVSTAGEKGLLVRLIAADGGDDRVLGERVLSGPRLILSVTGRRLSLCFSCGNRADALGAIGPAADGRLLSTERAGGFAGTVVGLYATSRGFRSVNHADFDWFSYGPV